MNDLTSFLQIIHLAKVNESLFFSFWNYSSLQKIGYVFTRGGYVELSKKLSLPLGSTLDRFVILAYSMGPFSHWTLRAYILVLLALRYKSLSCEVSLSVWPMFRYEGLVLSVGGNGRSYAVILEAGPSADTTQSKMYFARISTKVGFCRVSIISSVVYC